MDARSHELFAIVLLKAVGKSDISPQWGNAPDIDMAFLHRWRRHRISVMPKTYIEFKNNRQALERQVSMPGTQLSTQDREAVSLCVVGHLYLDIFNGPLYPFGLWHPIIPNETIIEEVLNDIDRPKIFVKALERFTGEESFLQKFYSSSKELMEGLIVPESSIEMLTAQFVQRLAYYAGGEDSQMSKALYYTAMKQIAGFTGNNRYGQGSIFPNQTHNVCARFEVDYAKLIEKALEE